MSVLLSRSSLGRRPPEADLALTLARIESAVGELTAKVDEIDRRVQRLGRTVRQGDRRVVSRVESSLTRQTDEVLATMDAWLPKADGAPVGEELDVDAAIPPTKRKRRWLRRGAAVAVLGGLAASPAIPAVGNVVVPAVQGLLS